MQTHPFIPESAPFNSAQRLWLNGFLAGLLAGSTSATSTPQAMTPASARRLLIVFGSQTGTAEALARRIAREAKGHGCEPRVVDASSHAMIDWSKETHLLVVTSTYGDGDMPDNAQPFWDWLQTDAASSLAHLQYSVLGLGDTHYEQFCAAGKKIDARLEQLGATRIHSRADCDLDYEGTAKAWMEAALSALFLATRGTSEERIGERGSLSEIAPPLLGPTEEREKSISLAARPLAAPFNRTNPFPARLLLNRRLNADGSGKETRHFELSLVDSGLNYVAGDALGVCPTNCPELVEDLLRRLGCDGEEAVPLPSGAEAPFRKALSAAYDITRPTSELIKRIAESANGKSVLRELLMPGRQDELNGWLRGREVIDVLLEAPDLRLTADEFVTLLKKLAPRLYSISSSPKAHTGQVHLTINIVRYDSHRRSRKGVASTFLADRARETTPVPIFVQSSPNFRLPANSDAPVIMIGPGTGIAPFRAFLHERRISGAKGRNWLFFGEQHAATDFYYRDELESMRTDGHLTRLDTAFSRDQAEKLYVQHRMLEQGPELWKWLQEGAHLYVCGDASRMAKDVDTALHKVIESAGASDRERAAAFVQQLKSDKRYQRDVY